MALLDLYGAQAITEDLGQCSVQYNGTQITLPELGHIVDINGGLATFQQFSVIGTLLPVASNALVHALAASSLHLDMFTCHLLCTS